MQAQHEDHFLCRRDEAFRWPDSVREPSPEELEAAALSVGAAAQQTVCREILRGMQLADYTLREQTAVQIGLTEALANAFRHGNASDPSKTVDLSYAVDETRVWIRVADEGPGFALDQVPDPTAPENLSRPSGRGLLLMRSFMDEVKYNDAGNVVTMVKYRLAVGSG